jgi:hypothetical protein
MLKTLACVDADDKLVLGQKVSDIFKIEGDKYSCIPKVLRHFHCFYQFIAKWKF